MRRYPETPCGTPRNGERGSALVELALAMPIMLALAGAIVDGGWALHQAAVLGAAAEAAQRAAALQDTGAGNCAGAPPASYGELSKAAAAAAAPTLDPSRLNVAVSYAEPACTGRMRTLVVGLAYTLRAVTPWFTGLLNGRSITAQAGSAVEEVPPPWWASAAQVQAQQAQIASLTSAYQAMQSAASYYYMLWQQLLRQQAADGLRDK
jgi:Flp pilus assembly protein TadG